VSSLASRHLDCQDVTVNGYKPRDSPLPPFELPQDEHQIANALIEEAIGNENSASRQLTVPDPVGTLITDVRVYAYGSYEG
jgi:hypothetical protein